MFKNKKFFMLVPALLIMSLFLVACADGNGAYDADTADNGEQVADATGTDVLVAALAAESRTMDLHRTNDTASAQVTRQIFETLVKQDAQMNIVPGLAHYWFQYDERVWEFHLNDGVYFHNGDRMTAYDVYATFQRAAVSPHVAAILGMIDVDTIEVVDELTFRVGTPYPFAPFLSHLAHSAAGIMNANELAGAGDLDAGDFEGDLDRNPIGTGPFRFVEWVSGDRIVLERNDDYHATIEGIGIPSFSGIEIRFMPEARVVALETGDIHIDLNPFPDDFARIEGTPNLRLESVEGLRSEYLGMNVEHPYLSDARVRQAINYAIDVQAIVDAIYQGHGVAGRTHLAASVFGHNPYIEGFGFDVERAQQLMAEAGFADGFTINLYANTERADRVAIAQIVEQNLQAININVQVQQLAWAELLTLLDAGQAPMFFVGWTTVTGDGDYGLFPVFHTSQRGAAGNFTFFSNDRLDTILEAARATTDVEARLAYYFEAQEILTEEAPWVIMLQERSSAFYNYSIVENFIVEPIGTHFFGNINLR